MTPILVNTREMRVTVTVPAIKPGASKQSPIWQSSTKPWSRSLLSHKDEFPDGGLKRWRNVPAFLRIWDIARWAGSYTANK